MKKIKINIKWVIAIIFLILLLASIMVVGSLANRKIDNYDKYEMQIKIEAFTLDEKREVYTINVKDDGVLAKAETSFLANPVYIKDGKMIYEEGGRYKMYSPGSTYKDIYATIQNIELKDPVADYETEKSYNPSISKDVINALLEELQIDKKTARDEFAFVTVKKNKISEFSVYIIDLEGFKGVNLSLAFEGKNSEYSIESPVFYSAVTDEYDGKNLKLLNGN